MLDKLRIWKIALVIVLVVELVLLFACYFLIIDVLMYLSFVILVVNSLIVGFIIFNYQTDMTKRSTTTAQILGDKYQQAISFGGVGLMIYGNDYEVTWVSELLENFQEDFISKKITKIIPEIRDLFDEETDQVEFAYKRRRYIVSRKEGEQVLLWREVTDSYKTKLELDTNKTVIGLIHLDNYNETIQNEDEQVISLINTNLRQMIDRWAKANGILIRRIRSDRFVLVLNEKIYGKIEQNYFSILDDIRNEALKINVVITMSMAFARGTHNLAELDEMASNLLELALSRGGDQVAMRSYQGSIKYFGGSSEAVEKRSKVKARVMSRTIKDLISDSENVIVVGHKDIDFDCMGSMLAVSTMAREYCENVFTVSVGISYDSQLEMAMNRYGETIANRHNFISEGDGILLLGKNSLVICVDHHHLGLCSAPSLVEDAQKLVVIDHHRRGEHFFSKPILVYVEPSASSTCELVSELIEYQPQNIELEPLEATLMLTGIIVDTNHFRVRSGTRTFAAASFIKTKGADASETESFLKENYLDFESKNRIYGSSELFTNEIIIAAVDDGFYNRTLVSQAADSILNINNIEASFVVAKVAENQVIISARSKGHLNVQTTLEKLGGGGHFSAAGLQREGTSVADLTEELKQALREDVEDESNLIK